MNKAADRFQRLIANDQPEQRLTTAFAWTQVRRILTIALLTFVAVISHSNVVGQDLSEEGLKEKARHDYLFDDFLKGRETKYQSNGEYRALKEVTILKETREIRDGDELLLPEGTQRIAGLFRHFGFRGADLDRIKEVHVAPFSPDKAPPRSIQVKDFYRIQMPSIPLSDKPFGQMKIKFLMKDKNSVCRIVDLTFIAQKAIPPKFDTIPYRDLGSEFPRERVEIWIDTDNELVVGGTADLQRNKWFRMHETPGVVDQTFEKWAKERNFLPGRGAFKFNPALTREWGPNPVRLKERADKPGAADLSFFEKYDAGTRQRNAIPLFQEKPFALCFNDWPEFMSVPLEGRGTPLVEHFDNAAELAAAYVADQIKDGGFTAAWWEVKNESSVRSEWAHHWQEKQGIDGWGLLAEFHNKVADAVHKVAPDVKVGGPSSAYMQVQVKDFALYRNQARFIEETRGYIDFFSHHFYENALMLGAHERRGMGYSNYLLGRYEAILDMLRAHMQKVDNVLPILITETGSLQNGRKPSDNWLRLLAWNAYLNKSMQRPDQIDMFVPFVFLHMSWNPMSGDAAFTPKTDRKRHRTVEDFDRTTISYFFELWRDFDGRRLPVKFDRDWLDVTAIHDGNRISLAVTNMGGRQVALDLSGVAKQLGITVNSGMVTAKQTRLNYHKGKVAFEPEHEVQLTAVPVDVNETTVVRLELPAPLKLSGKLQLNRHYANETATKSTGEKVSYEIHLPNKDRVKDAKLILGLHRRGGVTETPLVKINGQVIKIDTGDANEFSEFFAPLDANVSPWVLKENNKIEVTAQPETTITSVQLVTHSEIETDSAKPPLEDGAAKEVKHLFGPKLLLARFVQVDLTNEQLSKFNRLSSKLTTEVMALRDKAGITKELIKKRDEVFKSVSKTDLEGDEFWRQLQRESVFTDEQRIAFQKTKDLTNAFKKNALAILTDDQRKNLQNQQRSRSSSLVANSSRHTPCAVCKTASKLAI